jgi:hypothetical protein
MVETLRLAVRYFTRVHQKERSVETTRRPGVLSRDAYRRIIEKRAHDKFGMSLTEFAEAFQAGELSDDPAAIELAVVSGVAKR